MTDFIPWFRYQLKASADGFEWAFTQLPPAYQIELPPDPPYMGTWPAVRHVWHVTEYERCLALPSMYAWLGVPLAEKIDWPDDDAAWAKIQSISFGGLLAEFRRVRQHQIDLLDQLAAVDWNEPRDTLWGQKPLSMIVTKTFQHTYEHGDTLMRMGLWWEETLAEQSQQGDPPSD